MKLYKKILQHQIKMIHYQESHPDQDLEPPIDDLLDFIKYNLTL